MVARRTVNIVEVRTLRASATRGLMIVGNAVLRCALGRSGCRAIKREGDGATPIGRWSVRSVFYRPDRVGRPSAGVPVRRIRPDDGWCDAPADPNYNRRVRHPYAASAEHMWRDDDLYDVVVVLGHNDLPRQRGAGSAIFLHVARADWRPTAGCVVTRRPELQRLVQRLGTDTVLAVNVTRRPKKKALGQKGRGLR